LSVSASELKSTPEERAGGEFKDSRDRDGRDRDERPRGRSDRGRGSGHPRRSRALAVIVDDRGLDSALRTFKKLVAKEGLLKDLKRRQYYEKPGERRRRTEREANRRRRRQQARSRAYSD